jgi:hypothetical protein
MSDREDALKLAQLSAVNQLEMAHIPNRQVRQKRSTEPIEYKKQGN